MFSTSGPLGFLFDLDGVIVDTEPQYDIFWGGQFREHYPDHPEWHRKIKGQTLVEIYARFFLDKALQRHITEQLNRFEAEMPMPYVAGFTRFVESLREAGYRSAIVTSSNRPKMESVFRRHPELPSLVDRVVTAEDFSQSKPSPECYQTAARGLGLPMERCIAFEDSLNGLASAMSAGAHVVGLTTSLSAETIQEKCHLVVSDFTTMTLEDMLKSLKIQ